MYRCIDRLVDLGLLTKERHGGGKPTTAKTLRPNLYTLPIHRGDIQSVGVIHLLTQETKATDIVSLTTDPGVTRSIKNLYEPSEDPVEKFRELKAGLK